MTLINKKIDYKWLDLIRGFAALAVFIMHLRILCIKDVEIFKLDLLGKSIFFITGFGHIAVVIFFVLSGFLIIKSINESYIKNNFSISKYAINRMARLWIVLIPCLILGLLFDKIGLKYFSDTLFYSNQFKYFFHQDLASKLSLKIFLGNTFFLQTILTPTFGSNAALWTLAYEFWYYAIFPCFYFGFFGVFRLKLRLLLIFTGTLLLIFVGSEISLYFILWLGGGLSYIISKKVNERYLCNKYLRFFIVGLFVISMILLRSKYQPFIFNNFSVGLMFSLSIPFLINININNKILSIIASYLSNISYTLYLAHIPFMNLITSFFNYQGKDWSFNSFFYLSFFVVIIMLYATLIWYLFERNTSKIKKITFGI